MSDSFNTTINSSLKNILFPLVTSTGSILTGFYMLSLLIENQIASSQIPGILFIASGLSLSIFSVQNYKLINGWGLYLLFGLLVMLTGIYITVSEPSVYVTGLASLLRSGILLGAPWDLKKHEHADWGNIGIASITGVIFSVILIAGPDTLELPVNFVMAGLFISTGIAGLLLYLELRKVNRFYGLLKKLTKSTKLVSIA
ncbi:DUF308 domain-containing protein [Elizabethkingia anophelis]|nr:DUF308 domain-containing protein [Elizabethkingia anophelis]